MRCLYIIDQAETCSIKCYIYGKNRVVIDGCILTAAFS